MKSFVKIILLARLTSLAAQAQPIHHGELANNGSLYFRAEPVNNFLPDKQGKLYYYLHLQGATAANDHKSARVPLNLCVVLDRSGSMNGNKLNYTKEALKYVVKQLDAHDILSIVLYENEVEVLLEPQHLEDKNKLLADIERIVTGGGTNLEGGIKKGYELVNKVRKINSAEMINRVLLLSDGLANVGEIEPEALSAITRSYFENDHISISTFGVGNDYNENLMAKIALQGGGLYYFIYSPEKLPGIFDEELKGLSIVVAKNTSIKIKFPEELSYERTFSFNSNLNKNEIEISFNDLFADEQKSILICFNTKSKLNSPIAIQSTLSYLNAGRDSMAQVTDIRRSEIKPAANQTEYDNGHNRAASEGYALAVSQNLYDEAVDLASASKYKDAKIKVDEARLILDTHFKKVGEHVFLRELDKKLSEYTLLVDELKNMDRETFQYNIKLTKQDGFKRKIRSKF
jgi:Ca-activated chloride channel homolog